MSSFKVFKGKIDIYGDLHLSSTYTGTHKEYVSECYKTMDIIIERTKEHQQLRR